MLYRIIRNTELYVIWSYMLYGVIRYSSLVKTATDTTLPDDVSLSIRGPSLDSHTKSVSNTNLPPTSRPDISDKIHPIPNNIQPRMCQSLLQNVTLPKASQTQSPIQSPVPVSSTSATSSFSLPNYPTASQQPFTWGNLTGLNSPR